MTATTHLATVMSLSARLTSLNWFRKSLVLFLNWTKNHVCSWYVIAGCVYVYSSSDDPPIYQSHRPYLGRNQDQVPVQALTLMIRGGVRVDPNQARRAFELNSLKKAAANNSFIYGPLFNVKDDPGCCSILFCRSSHLTCHSPNMSLLAMVAPSSSTLVTGPLRVLRARIIASDIAQMWRVVVSVSLAWVWTVSDLLFPYQQDMSRMIYWVCIFFLAPTKYPSKQLTTAVFSSVSRTPLLPTSIPCTRARRIAHSQWSTRCTLRSPSSLHNLKFLRSLSCSPFSSTSRWRERLCS